MRSLLITEAQSKKLLHFIKYYKPAYNFIAEKNKLEFSTHLETQLTFRIPISILSPGDFFAHPEDRSHYVLVLIRSGIASVGYFEDGENMDHKVFRAYMVRKKQGKSQIKYLKTKGKSRAGSRVRLAETLVFFEEINQKLNAYFNAFRVDRIGLSCPKTLIPFVFGSKIPTPFRKDDPRILNIPKHIHHPSYEALLEINRYLLMGELKYGETGIDLFENFIQAVTEKIDPPEEDEDW